MTYFTTMSILETLAFTWGKSETNGYFGNFCSLIHETWQMQTTNEVNKGMCVFNVKVIS